MCKGGGGKEDWVGSFLDCSIVLRKDWLDQWGIFQLELFVVGILYFIEIGLYS